jgi:predicted transcriptional regulator
MTNENALMEQKRMWTRRLSFDVIVRISQLATWLNTNDTEVAETAIRQMYDREAPKHESNQNPGSV